MLSREQAPSCSIEWDGGAGQSQLPEPMGSPDLHIPCSLDVIALQLKQYSLP